MCSRGQAVFVNLAFLRQGFVQGMRYAIRIRASVTLGVFRDVVEQASCLWELVCRDLSEVG